MSPILHRDIKPKNILLFKNKNEPVLKLTDFGGSTVDTSKYKSVRGFGSPGWVANEVLKNQVPTEKSDIFSLGMVKCVSNKTFHDQLKFFKTRTIILNSLY